MDAGARETNALFADDEVVWSWTPDAEAKLAGVTNVASDGGNKARSPGRVRIRRKTIAQGRLGFPAEPVVPSPCFFYCTGAMGISRYPAFPAPSSCEGANDHAESGRFSAAGTRSLVSINLVASNARGFTAWTRDSFCRSRR